MIFHSPFFSVSSNPSLRGELVDEISFAEAIRIKLWEGGGHLGWTQTRSKAVMCFSCDGTDSKK